MAIIEFAVAPAKRDNGFISTTYDLTGKPDILPRRRVECSKAKEAAALFDAYVAEAKATGIGLSVTMMLRAGKAPMGFKKLGWKQYVNLD